MRLHTTNGQLDEEVLITSSDYELVKDYKWHIFRAVRDNYTAKYVRAYVGRIEGKTKWVHLHRVIINPPKHLEVDHINGDGLDNQRENLRAVTRSQNQLNRHYHKKTNENGYVIR